MSPETDREGEGLERRCPRLGGLVSFRYCLTCGEDGEACFKIFDCWWEKFDVVSYLKENLPPDQFARLENKQPKPKIQSILEIMEKVKNNVSTDREAKNQKGRNH